MTQTPDDPNEALKRAMGDFASRLVEIDSKILKQRKKIIADGVAALRRGHTLSKADNRFLKKIRVSAW